LHELVIFDEKERAAFLVELRSAARQVVTGHGVDPGLLDDLMGSAMRFFALPESEKLAVEMANSPHFGGYTRMAGVHARPAGLLTR
jgi:isopenicillin N synthase-like dioxygenase